MLTSVKERRSPTSVYPISVRRISALTSFNFLLTRLTPAYLFVLGINEIAIKHTLSRTVFSPAIIDHLTCEKFWWRNALYLNSLYPRTEMVRILIKPRGTINVRVTQLERQWSRWIEPKEEDALETDAAKIYNRKYEVAGDAKLMRYPRLDRFPIINSIVR